MESEALVQSDGVLSSAHNIHDDSGATPWFRPTMLSMQRLYGGRFGKDDAFFSFETQEVLMVARPDGTTDAIRFYADVGLPSADDQFMTYRYALQHNLMGHTRQVTLGLHPVSQRIVATSLLRVKRADAQNDAIRQLIDGLLHCVADMRRTFGFFRS